MIFSIALYFQKIYNIFKRYMNNDNVKSISNMTVNEISEMKHKWRIKQYKRVSNYAVLFGPRNSVKVFWDPLLEMINDDDKIQNNEKSSSKIKNCFIHLYTKLTKSKKIDCL